MTVRKWFCFLCALMCVNTVFCIRQKNPVESREPLVPGKHLVYIQNYHCRMWVGSNSDSLANVMQNLVRESEERWIGGGVVPASSVPHGFYFDPNTIVISELTVEGMQTTIEQIAQDPAYYAENGWSNGLTDHAWYVWGLFLKYRAGE